MRILFKALLICLAVGIGANAATAFEAPALITIPAGDFISGSDRKEREYAYQLDEKAYGHSVTRKQGWYEGEPVKTLFVAKFEITPLLVTNGQYAIFLAETKHRRPFVSARIWAGYGLIHPYSRAKRHLWNSRTPPKGRENHPVVMVSVDDAMTYAKWLSAKTGNTWRLPTAVEWEKAARGTNGRYFPWGNKFDISRLNSHDAGPFDTMPVGRFAKGASPYGMLDAAGQVFEWTGTVVKGKKRHVVKGGSWDDKGCGVCRPAAGHSRPDGIKHILIGFRLVRER